MSLGGEGEGGAAVGAAARGDGGERPPGSPGCPETLASGRLID